MMYKISAIIILAGEIDLKTLYFAISPENDTITDGTISTRIDKNTVVTELKGKMSIGRMINTIDDVLKTAILANNIYNAT